MSKPLYPVHVFYHFDKTRDTIDSVVGLSGCIEEHDSKDFRYIDEVEIFDAKLRPLHLVLDDRHELTVFELESDKPSPRALELLEEYTLIVPVKDWKRDSLQAVGCVLLLCTLVAMGVAVSNVVSRIVQAQIAAWGLLILIVSVTIWVRRVSKPT